MLKSAVAQTTTKPFTFNMRDIDGLFPGFKAGEFAIIYGSQTVTPIVSKLCVRAQLPVKLGGLESNVVFIDCANSSSLSYIVDAAKQQQSDSKTVLERVVHMRVYTAYRLTTLIMDKLEETVESSQAKLVVISDLVGPFLNGNVDDQEANAVYRQVMGYLANFARRHRIIIIATYLSHENNQRNSTLQEITNQKAGTVIRFTKTPYTGEVELEKHPSYMLGVVDFSPETQTLTDFTSSNGEVSSLTYRILQ